MRLLLVEDNVPLADELMAATLCTRGAANPMT